MGEEALQMGSKMPVFSEKIKICIICEGNEEYAYLEKIKSLNVWNDQYEIFLDNAGGMEIFRQDIRIVIRTMHMN